MHQWYKTDGLFNHALVRQSTFCSSSPQLTQTICSSSTATSHWPWSQTLLRGASSDSSRDLVSRSHSSAFHSVFFFPFNAYGIFHQHFFASEGSDPPLDRKLVPKGRCCTRPIRLQSGSSSSATSFPRSYSVSASSHLHTQTHSLCVCRSALRLVHETLPRYKGAFDVS